MQEGIRPIRAFFKMLVVLAAALTALPVIWTPPALLEQLPSPGGLPGVCYVVAVPAIVFWTGMMLELWFGLMFDPEQADYLHRPKTLKAWLLYPLTAIHDEMVGPPTRCMACGHKMRRFISSDSDTGAVVCDFCEIAEPYAEGGGAVPYSSQHKARYEYWRLCA